MAIRIVLAEDNALLREGIRSLIEAQVGLELVGLADDYDSLLGLVESEQPDVVLTDIRMPPTGTDEGIRAAAHPDALALAGDVDLLIHDAQYTAEEPPRRGAYGHAAADYLYC